MTDNFQTLFLEHLAKIENDADRIKFIDKLLKFYTDYDLILKKDLNTITEDLLKEFNEKEETLPSEITHRFDEHLATEVARAKTEEEKKIKTLIDWLLEQRFNIQK
jgi:Zn-dependent M16 (insulinase) family peptidase